MPRRYSSSKARQAASRMKSAIRKYETAVRRRDQNIRTAVSKYHQAVRTHNSRVRANQQRLRNELATLLLFFTLNREDFSFVIHLDRQPRTSRRREAQTGSRARSGSRSERTLDAVEHSRTLMGGCPGRC